MSVPQIVKKFELDPGQGDPRILPQLSIEDVYNAALVGAYSILLYTSAVLSTIMFLLTVYTVLKHSTASMSYYKLFILNCVLWGYLYSLFVCILQPVMLMPLIVGYLAGGLASVFDDIDMDFHLITAMTVFFTNYVIGLILSIFYRFLLLRNANGILKKLSTPIGLSVLILLLTAITSVSSYYFVQTFRLPQSEFMARIKEAHPNLAPLLNSHRMLGYYSLGDYSMHVGIFILLPVGSMTMLVGFNALLYAKQKREARKLFSNQSSKSVKPIATTFATATKPANNRLRYHASLAQTHRLQIQLHRMNTLQIALLIILLVGPFVLSLFSLALKLRHTFAIVIIFLSLSSTHCIADNIVILLFIRPYRDSVFRLLYKLFGLKLGKNIWANGSSVVQNPPPVPTKVNTIAGAMTGRISWRHARRNAEAEVARDRDSEQTNTRPIEDIASTSNIITERKIPQSKVQQSAPRPKQGIFRRLVTKLRNCLTWSQLSRDQSNLAFRPPRSTHKTTPLAQVFNRQTSDQPRRSKPRWSLIKHLQRAQSLPRMAQPNTTVTRVVHFKSTPNKLNHTIRSVE
ncbi:serpentine type 7TM GPCR chemoreceptor srh domain-containing protein [Ditylenchus destructor]|uniref:Serpentine type 7TM GPCR chemoreceptor srh domain-containing protein n=1 Tax=Ditylenchus destructor TaxID=166010 RepID=A0AAD4MS06_9BILA|nr:serpentine type 7TM GPCR chemoreceptor srh domain-containing protein [Ditylenchus destructor]